MNKKYLLTFLLLCVTVIIFCTPVTETRARQVALNLSLERSGHGMGISSIEYLGADAQSLIYIVNLMPAGFVLVASDDASQPVLGYDFHAGWVQNNLPVQLADLIGSWKQQLRYIVDHHIVADTAISNEWQRLTQPTGVFQPQRTGRDVTPLITSTWGQEGYYNDLCPGGTPVGCVATAMSQIMRYWAFPTTGNSNHSYSCPPYGTLSADFGSTTYNWAAMPNQVSSSNTSVATLCYQAGVAVNMQYDPTGSGAFSFDVPYALETYFKYATSTNYYEKASYSDATWHSMMQGELNNARPVYYSGTGPDGGHAFILDGFQATNHYHINWGWNGYDNGYYYLTALNPGGYDFTSQQAAVIGIRPTETSANLSQNFEGTTFPPFGWAVTASSWARSATSFISGAYSARYSASGTTNAKQLRTPKLIISATSNPITYKAKCGTTVRGETIYTRYSTDGTNWTTLNTQALTATAATYSVPVNGLTPGNYYICFETYSSNTNASQAKAYYIDDVTGPELTATAALNITTWNAGNVSPGETGASGAIFQLSNIGGGTLSVTSVTDLSATEFKSTLNPAVQLVYGQVHEFGFTYDPLNYGTDNSSYIITTNGGTLTITLSASAVAYRFSDGFETYSDFALTCPPWTQYDGDASITWGVDGVDFTNSGEPGAFVIFNPSQAVPSMVGTTMDTYSGHKGAYCFSDILASYGTGGTGPNNDWLITPAISLTGPTASVNFWAKSYSNAYGLERFKVRISTTTNNPLTAFTTYLAGSASAYVEAPITWTNFTYSLNAYAGMTVYIAVQCVSNDAFFFMLDNFAVLDSGYNPPAPTFGNVNGYVYKFGTSVPIPNALVTIGTKSATTNASGLYQINNLVVGTYDATCTTPGADFYDTSASGIAVTQNHTTNQNFYMKWSELAASPTSFDVSLYSLEQTNRTLTISNPGGTDSLAVALYLTDTTAARHQSSSLNHEERRAKPDRRHQVIPQANIALDRSPDWVGYNSIEDMAWYAPYVSERGSYFVLEDFGLYGSAGLTVSKIRHWFYDLNSNNWGGANTFTFKIYGADATTVLFTSPTLTANAYPTVTEYTLPTPMTFHDNFMVVVVPGDQTGGMPYSLATDFVFGCSYYWDTTDLVWYQLNLDFCLDVYADGTKWLAFDAYPNQLDIYKTVGPAGSSDFNLHFDANNLGLGTRTANLKIFNSSNYIAPNARGDVMIIPLSFTVSAPPATGDISGYVREANTLAPLGGAVVTVGSRTTTSDSLGFYQMLDVVVGTYTATCVKTHYSIPDFSVSITENHMLTRDILMDWARMVPVDAIVNYEQASGTVQIHNAGVNNPGTLPLTWDSACGIWGGDYAWNSGLNQDWETGDITGWSGWVGPDTQIYTNTDYGYEGGMSSAFVFQSESCSSPQWLITPKLHVQTGNHFTFKYKQFNETGEILYIKISTTTSDTLAFTTTLSTIGPMAGRTWNSADLDLSAYNGQDVYIAFYYTKVLTEYAYVFLDMITGPSALLPPQNWLSTPVSTGIVAAGSSGPVGLQIDTNGLPAGHYTAQTWLFSDQTVASPVKYYVNLTVIDAAPATPLNPLLDRPANTSLDLILSWDASQNANHYEIYAGTNPFGDFSSYVSLGTTTLPQATITQDQLATAGITGSIVCFRVTADNAPARFIPVRTSRESSSPSLERLYPKGKPNLNKLKQL